MKKLFLHIGTHKTGTTTFQKFCKDNQETLSKEHGLNYIHYAAMPDRKEIMKAERVDEKIVNNLKKFLAKATHHPANLHLLSWEGFSGDFSAFYSNVGTVSQIVEAALPEDIICEIIVCFRRQDQFLQSLYNQKIQQGEFEEKDSFFVLNGNKTNLNWIIFLEKLQNVFGSRKIHVLPYDPSILQKKSIVELIFGAIERIDATAISQMWQKENIEVNVGFSKASAALFELLSKQISSERTKFRLRRILQEIDNKSTFTKYHIIDERKEEEILAHFRPGNHQLAATYWQDRYGLEGFTSYFTEDKNQEPKEDLEIRLIAYLLGRMEQQEADMRNSYILKIANRLHRLFK